MFFLLTNDHKKLIYDMSLTLTFINHTAHITHTRRSIDHISCLCKREKKKFIIEKLISQGLHFKFLFNSQFVEPDND